MFKPHSSDWLLNKFEIYEKLRNADVAYYSNEYQMHVFTRYDDVKFILSNQDIFSSARGNLICEEEFRFGNTLGASDNPTHDVYKNIVKDAYSKKHIERIVNVFADKAKDLLSNKKCFNISLIIEELSAWATVEILNIPYDKEELKDIILGIQRHSPACVANNTSTAFTDEFQKLIQDLSFIQKAEADGPGIYKDFVTNNPNKLPVFSLFHGPTISGASSLTGSLEFLTLDLCTENQLDLLLNDRSLIPLAVDESLRFHASTGRFSRTVMQEVTLHNVKLSPGDRVAACLDSANRDPDKFSNPNKFDINRDTSGHLSFGFGVHACIALAFSRMLMITYLEILLDVMGKYKITTPREKFDYVITASGNNDMISNLEIIRL